MNFYISRGGTELCLPSTYPHTAKTMKRNRSGMAPIVPHGLPPSTYPKGYFHRTPYPNLFRDETRHRLDGVVYANNDYFHKDAPKVAVRSYLQLSGGLTHRPTLPWNYPEKTEDEEILEQIAACEVEEALFKPDFPLTDKRFHLRFTAGRRQLYLPFVSPLITMPSHVGNLTVNSHRAFTRPDFQFIKDTQQALTKSFHCNTDDETQVRSIYLNPGIVNIRLLTTDVKDATIRHLGRTVKKQKDLEQFTYENAFLSRTDAIRIIVALALGAGHTLQKLYLCNLFAPNSLPIETESEYLDVYNEVPYNPDCVPEFSEATKTKVWREVLERPSYDNMSLSKLDNYLIMSLRCFSNLTTLMVNYTWLSKGNGVYLVYLDAVRKGTLKKLILMLTPGEHPINSRQVISYQAWEEALRLCPALELHLIMSQNAVHLDLNKVLVRSMPLTSIHFSSVYPLADVRKQKPWFFSYVTRFLHSYFHRTLRMITMEVWHPTTSVDVGLANLILKCPYLRVFMYRGNMDKLDTIHAICRLLIEEKRMRLRKIGFFIGDDPCRPKGWTEAIQSTREKFEAPLALKGIVLYLGIWKF